MERTTFGLKPLPPFRLDLTVWALRRRPNNIVDRWDGQTYRRILALEDKLVEVAVVQTGMVDAPRLEVTVTGVRLAPEVKSGVTTALKRILGLDIDLTEFYRLAARDAKLDALARRFRGMKPPRFPTPFEALTNAVACQQLTLTLGILLLNRLAETYGAALREAHAFPRPADLVGLRPMAFRKLGFSRQKGRYLIDLARMVHAGRLDLDALEQLDNVTAIEQLLELRGVGRWTAEYVLLRGLGRVNVFPGDDVGARNHLERWLKLRQSLDYEGVRHAMARWEPFAGLIYFHLRLDQLDAAGYLQSPDGGLSMIQIKRVYEPPSSRDGKRFLVERLWPRGMKKGNLHAKAWLKEVAPSTGLRQWFGHDPSKWKEFQKRYRAELRSHTEALQPLLNAARHGKVTLLYSAHDQEFNNAIVLKTWLEKQLGSSHANSHRLAGSRPSKKAPEIAKSRRPSAGNASRSK